MPRQSFSSFILSDTKAHAQHQHLLHLQGLESSYVSAGIAKSVDQNTSLKSLYNILYSSRPFSFPLHKATLDIIDNVPCRITLRFPVSHRVRLFKLCILSVLHADHEVFHSFASSGYLKNINKRLISVFTLFHLCLRSSHHIVQLAISMDPETKWPNPLLFIKPYRAPEKAGESPGSTESPSRGPESSYSYGNWATFTHLFRRLSPFYPVLYSTYNQLLSLKNPRRTWVHRDTFLFPLDLSCIRGDTVTFNYIVTTYPHAIKLSPLSFYLTSSCKMGLKLFYYNNEVPENALHYHATRGNYDMVALILEVRKELNKKNKYGETPATLSARNRNFHTLSLLMEKSNEAAQRLPPREDEPGHRTAILSQVESEASVFEWDAQTFAEMKKFLFSEAASARSTDDVLKNLNWMRRHVWNEKDTGTFFHLSNTEKARRFMRKLGTGIKQHNFNKDYSLLCILKSIYKNRDVRAHNPMEYLFDAFGDLINF